MSNKIKSLEKKIDQLANRISLQKTKERFLEKKRKTSLGKIFIMAGARDFFDQKNKNFSFVIGLGGLFYIAEMQDYKLSVLLGVCHLMFERLGNDNEAIKYIATVGDDFYYAYLNMKKSSEKTSALEHPLNFFLGIIVEAKKFLNSDEKIEQCHQIGDKMFIELKNKKIEKYKDNLQRPMLL